MRRCSRFFCATSALILPVSLVRRWAVRVKLVYERPVPCSQYFSTRPRFLGSQKLRMFEVFLCRFSCLPNQEMGDRRQACIQATCRSCPLSALVQKFSVPRTCGYSKSRFSCVNFPVSLIRRWAIGAKLDHVLANSLLSVLVRKFSVPRRVVLQVLGMSDIAGPQEANLHYVCLT